MKKDASWLMKQISALKSVPSKSGDINDPWVDHRNSFRQKISQGKEQIDKFLCWPVMHAVMFVGNSSFVKEEYEVLFNSHDEYRWRIACNEPKIGSPPVLPYDTSVSGNFIHQANHVYNWERAMGLRIEDLSTIVEFGGGYGVMCLIAHRLGFSGEYHIYDLSEFSLLQQYYLENAGLDCSNVKFHQIDNGRFAVPPRNADLLIGTYSLSEVNSQMREAFFDTVSPKLVLIAHQNIYGGENITNYFKHFTTKRANYNWMTVPISAVPYHKYLFGLKKND